MKYEDALKKIAGADSVGGQLIVIRDSKHILVGKSVQGTLIIEDTAEAKAVAAEVGIEVEAEVEVEATTHELKIEDSVETSDQMGGPGPPLNPPPPKAASKK